MGQPFCFQKHVFLLTLLKKRRLVRVKQKGSRGATDVAKRDLCDVSTSKVVFKVLFAFIGLVSRS
jgi:hypothetical protein